ncbi:MAG TPA: protein kinase [Planctomycetota bacterium]
MAPAIPDDQVQFAQLAVKQHYIQPEHVRSALELYRRYQTVGGEIPSIARILVAKGWLDARKGEVLLRHLINGDPLPPSTGALAAAQPAAAPVSAPAPARAAKPGTAGFEALDDLGLDGELENELPSAPAEPVMDEREAWVRGMGATVVRRDLVKGYKITMVVGEGSMGIVYRAHQISMDRTVALKVLPEDRTKDQRFVEEFLAEARNAGRLNHPNLIRVHEVGKSDKTYYYSMEYIEGQRLDEWMDECEGGKLDPKQAVNVFVQIAQALDYGFRSGVIHREIRPNTIMVNADGQAKLADLGLTKGEEARFLDGENASYVSPEQAAGKSVDTRTDIFSLGCCVFHCLTGEPPFSGGSPMEVLRRRLNAQTPDPREYNPSIPIELSRVIMKMMARDVTARYQTPGEAAEALKKITFAPPPAARKPLGAGLPRRPLRPGAPRPGAGRPMPGRPGAARPNPKDAFRRKRPGH